MTTDNSGYHDCPCRDCFEIAIGANTDGSASLCNVCESVGCDASGESDCNVQDGHCDDVRIVLSDDGTFERTGGVTITLSAHPEDQPVEGNASAWGDRQTDQAAECWIRAQLDSGNEWAWCIAQVTVEYQGHVATDHLGACSYKSAEDFRTNSGYYADMVASCLGQINADRRAIATCELAPHSKMILACVCGYKRTDGNGR